MKVPESKINIADLSAGALCKVEIKVSKSPESRIHDPDWKRDGHEIKTFFEDGMGIEPPKKYQTGKMQYKLGKAIPTEHQKWDLKHKYQTLNGNILTGELSKDPRQLRAYNQSLKTKDLMFENHLNIKTTNKLHQKLFSEKRKMASP